MIIAGRDVGNDDVEPLPLPLISIPQIVLPVMMFFATTTVDDVEEDEEEEEEDVELLTILIATGTLSKALDRIELPIVVVAAVCMTKLPLFTLSFSLSRLTMGDEADDEELLVSIVVKT